MITLTRALARQLRAILRKSTLAKVPRGLRLPFVLHADHDGLRLRNQQVDVAVEYHHPGACSPEVLALPAGALEDCEGRGDTPVTLESTAPETVQARWDDGGVPQLREYQARIPDGPPEFPGLPERWTDLEPGFRHAFDDAVRTAAPDAVRYALNRLQLRGAAGAIVGTDGHQLLMQTGFAWPWREDLLVPAVGVFACRELPPDAPMAVGRTATHVSVRVGPWTFHLAIDADGRFPKVDTVLPPRTGKGTAWRLSQADAAFLTRTLPRLPSQEDHNAPVTVDLDGTVALRAIAEGQGHPTELVLHGSEVAGPAVRCCVGRHYLLRALQLGFRELQIAGANAPIVCLDGRRSYTWMPLDPKGAVPPSADALRIASQPGESAVSQPDRAAEPRPKPQPVKQRRKTDVTKPSANGSAKRDAVSPPPPGTTGLSSVIEEAQALKEVLRDAYRRTSRLVAALQRQRKHSKLFQTALTSLRQLEHLDQ